MRESPFRCPADTAREDQLDAASHDARRIVFDVASARSLPYIPTPPGVARWLASAVVQSARAGRLMPCLHLGPSPTPALGVWTGPGVGRVGCATCQAEVTAAIQGTVTDRTCDRCASEVATSEPWSRLLVPLGAVLWTLGLCDRCGADLNLNLDTKANRHA